MNDRPEMQFRKHDFTKIEEPMPDHDDYYERKSKIVLRHNNNFMDVADGWPLLSVKQTFHLFRQMNYAKFRATTTDDPSSRNYYQTMAMNARHVLISANGRLAVSIAKKWMGSLDDLTSTAVVGLIRAVERFNCLKSYIDKQGNKQLVRFSTYATWVIRNALLDNYERRRRTFNERELTNKVAVSYTYEPDLDLLFESEEKQANAAAIKTLLRLCNQQQAEVLSMRFGLHPKPITKKLTSRKSIWTLNEIGKKLGLSKERIRQIEQEAIISIHDKMLKLNKKKSGWATGIIQRFAIK